MGDRNNPIKFGPEWLRNLSREPSAGGSSSNSPIASSGPPNNTGQSGLAQSGGSNSGAAGAAGSGGATTSAPIASPSAGGATAGGIPIPGPSTGAIPRTSTTHNNASPKVLLAKLRYGREEMLALYDRNAEAPDELKHFDLLYQPRGKPPVALNNTFEEDIREPMRGGPPVGGLSPGDRFGVGRGGMGRGAGMMNEIRGRSRMPFARQASVGRGNSWHGNSTRMPAYNPVTDEDGSSLRPWNNNNGGNTPNRVTNEPPEWTPNKIYKSRRQAHSTNWRQPHARDENEEWRSPENSRNNRSTADKWGETYRDWGDRPNQDRPQSWGSNRRTWGGNDPLHNEENLPEWAIDNAEAGAGTFDSSGAFHGYSNDDSNLPKSQEIAFPLARSHTHGSFVRSKTAEEGSDEWWASEKAKKLSSKKFEAGDTTFKKAGSVGSAEGAASNNKPCSSNDDLLDEPSKEETQDIESSDNLNVNIDDSTSNQSMFTSQFQESKTFDALMRSDIDLEDTRGERGKFHSVMMTQNNSLRQKHQHVAPVMADPSGRHHLNSGILQILQVMPMNQHSDIEPQNPEDKLVEEIFDMTLDDSKLPPNLASMHPSSCINPGMPNQMANQNLQFPMGSQVLQAHGMGMKGPNPSMQMPGLQGPMHSMQSLGLGNPMPQPIQNIGIQNSALNSSLGLPMPTNNNMVLPIPGGPPPVMHNSPMNPMASGMQGRMPGYQSGGGMSVAPGNVGNPSLFMGQNNPPQMQSGDIPMPNHNAPSNMFPMHPLQHSGSGPFGSMYNNIMPPPGPQLPQNDINLVDQWYYEDPEKMIQGPFSSKDMFNWYRAGFFSPTLMVRRACDPHMRPLGSYGPMPFGQMEVYPSFPMPSAFDNRPQPPPHPPAMGLDPSMWKMINDLNLMTPQMPPPTPDSLWSPPAPSAAELMWMQQTINNARNESRVNNLPVYFWEPQATAAIGPNSLLPEEIIKEMKTEDQILRELRASQNIQIAPPSQNVPFLSDQQQTISGSAPLTINKPEDIFAPNINATPGLDELQKLIQSDKLSPSAAFSGQPEPEPKQETDKSDIKMEVPSKAETPPSGSNQETQNVNIVVAPKTQQTAKLSVDTKTTKQTKNDTEKTVKNKDQNNGKCKNKKAKEEKKEDDAKNKEEDSPENKTEQKRSIEPSPTKGKKEEKNKKEMEREKRELTKDGFTMVRGTERGHKEQKKKVDEPKLSPEEVERKRREDEKQAFEEEKRRRIAEAVKKAQDQQQARMNSLHKRAPWSSASSVSQGPCKDGMTLQEIQRLEREKKVEQMKEQQHMMQLIAQQQAVALAREQEMQAGLGWAKKKGSNVNLSGQSLAEIQAETRKQSAAAAATAAAAAAQALDESQPPISLITPTHIPWGVTQNAGFWETPSTIVPPATENVMEPVKQATPEPSRPKKKVTITPAKKEVPPAVEFEAWCTSVLASWSSKIDVPTFVGFLRDIESPYEVKDYVKCYLGESKDACDFARQFLERRSKLLRVGMVTPSDDLCSPAMAINPRNTNLGDYQEVKGKGKKSKKNKMLKVDARILGFSVTASEDRINVGDIDTV